jgi:GDP-mannose 6-dehydrogenase
MQRISIFGLGYVGSVTAACLAHQGYSVIGVDPVPQKVETMATGKSPIIEAKLEDIIAEQHAKGRLTACSDPIRAVLESDVSFISVGTPSKANGRLELSHVQSVCQQIGSALKMKKEFHWIILRSTVLPGTTEEVVIPELEKSSGKRCGVDFGVCFNPEFLREGSAVSDFFQPPFTVVGIPEGTNADDMRKLYEWVPAPLFVVGLRTAEMVKYVCNAFHALKVVFGNEVGTLCNELGIDGRQVTEIYTADKQLNISPAYLMPGFAFGGSCLPKDLRAVNYKAKELDLVLPLLASLMPSNEEHIRRGVQSILNTGSRKIGVLGLSFKAGTDDLRESPMVILVKRLLGEGCHVSIWDKEVIMGSLIGSNKQFIQDVIPHVGSLLSDDLDHVLAQSEVVVLCTNSIKKAEVEKRLAPNQVLIDLMHLSPISTSSKTVTAAAK